jgi:ATP adenylyltransferase
MNRLHAYWRFEYVNVPHHDKNGDLFVDLGQKEESAETLVLVKRSHSFLVLNRYPYNPGHLLAAPYRKMASLMQLSEIERGDLMASIAEAEQILRRALNPDGFNVGFNIGSTAGAGIPQHLHAHVVPRWNGDTNFMPVIGDIRVLARSLEDMWGHLRKCL